MSDDFNFPGALAVLSGLFTELNVLMDKPPRDKQLAGRTLAAYREIARKLSSALGLMEIDPATWLLARRDRQVRAKGIDRAKVEAMIKSRDEARATKNYGESDRIRAELKDADRKSVV